MPSHTRTSISTWALQNPGPTLLLLEVEMHPSEPLSFYSFIYLLFFNVELFHHECLRDFHLQRIDNTVIGSAC